MLAISVAVMDMCILVFQGLVIMEHSSILSISMFAMMVGIIVFAGVKYYSHKKKNSDKFLSASVKSASTKSSSMKLSK
tara:strand:- start:120 stop:353 length:234 start_codon:yes stop_codon:yes gene_type:complete